MAGEKITVNIVCALPNLPVMSWDGPHWASRLDGIVPTLEEVGYTGLQVWPHRRLVRTIIADAARGDTELAGKWVDSVHQAGGAPGIKGAAMKLWVPGSTRSVGRIAALQDALPHPVPGVFYAHPGDKKLTNESTGTPVRMAQPAPEPYRAFKAYDATEFRGAMQGQGIEYVAGDLVHQFRRTPDGNHIPNPSRDFENHVQSGRMLQLHLPGDRSDLRKQGGFMTDIARGATALAGKNWLEARETLQGRLLTSCIESWVPPEVANNTLTVVVESAPPVVDIRESFVEYHKPFVDNIRHIAQAAGAAVLEHT